MKARGVKRADGSIVAVGRCIAFCEAPTVEILGADGKQIHWRADLCRVTDLTKEEIAVFFDPTCGATSTRDLEPKEVKLHWT